MFSLTTTDPDSAARCGTLETPHGTVETPVFMPVATMGTVKMLPPAQTRELGVRMLIANAFLLSLRPGIDMFREAGGLHGFMNWNGPIFTDSGGFQMIRRDFLQRVADEGVLLRSPFDGQKKLYTPERVVEIQSAMGSDAAMILDDVPPYGITREETISSMKRTLDWAQRARTAISAVGNDGRNGMGGKDDGNAGAGSVNEGQAFFAITHGGFYPGLREKCTRKIAAMDFDGYGIGGLCIGEPRDIMYGMLDATMPFLPGNKPRYLMGVGSPADIVECVARGVDIFDSVFPTRNARHGAFFVSGRAGRNDCIGERINLRARHASDLGPLDEACSCPVCMNHTRAYIYHLRKSGEYVWKNLLTVHNLWFMMRLMKKIRSAIEEGWLEELRQGAPG